MIIEIQFLTNVVSFMFSQFLTWVGSLPCSHWNRPFEDQHVERYSINHSGNKRKRERLGKNFILLHWCMFILSVSLFMCKESCYYRDWNINTAWRMLFKLRWPDVADQIQPTDWQQAYWETHLQKYTYRWNTYYFFLINWSWFHTEFNFFLNSMCNNSCLDEAAEIALVPSFNGYIGDIQIPGTVTSCSFSHGAKFLGRVSL